MKKWYQLEINVPDQTAELYLYGDITSFEWLDSDVSSFSMSKELEELDGKDLTVHINSYGGEVKEGLGIYNLLKAYPGQVTTVVDGFACSIASVIFMAGAKRIMNGSSLLMIHNAWSYAEGDSNALRKQADDLEKITQPSIAIYKENSTLDETAIRQMMDEETWITPEEALKYGFATEIKEAAKQSLQTMAFVDLVKKNKKMKSELEKKSNALNPVLDVKEIAKEICKHLYAEQAYKAAVVINESANQSSKEPVKKKGWFFHEKTKEE